MIVQIRHDIDVEELRDRAYSFDRTNPNWVDHAEHNLFFLRSYQNVFNDVLRARGYVFLNDILDSIGLPRTIEGAFVGWMLNFRGPVHIEFELIHEENLSNAVDIRFNIQDVILFEMPTAHSISVARHEIATRQQRDQGVTDE